MYSNRNLFLFLGIFAAACDSGDAIAMQNNNGDDQMMLTAQQHHSATVFGNVQKIIEKYTFNNQKDYFMQDLKANQNEPHKIVLSMLDEKLLDQEGVEYLLLSKMTPSQRYHFQRVKSNITDWCSSNFGDVEFENRYLSMLYTDAWLKPQDVIIEILKTPQACPHFLAYLKSREIHQKWSLEIGVQTAKKCLERDKLRRNVNNLKKELTQYPNYSENRLPLDIEQQPVTGFTLPFDITPPQIPVPLNLKEFACNLAKKAKKWGDDIAAKPRDLGNKNAAIKSVRVDENAPIRTIINLLQIDASFLIHFTADTHADDTPKHVMRFLQVQKECETLELQMKSLENTIAELKRSQSGTSSSVGGILPPAEADAPSN